MSHDPNDEQKGEVMKNILYLECAGGISGDMFVAAMLDLGASRKKLDAVLKSMCLDGFEYKVSHKNSHGIAGCDFDVVLENHHYEHEHHHHHEHRNLAEVETVIDRGDMTERARILAKKIFRIVADAEGKAHGCPVEEVHFHEVGAIDSIVDIVSAAVLFDDLCLEECIVEALTEGRGTVHCQHGELPVPVPAVLNIAQAHGIALRSSAVIGEMVTPTGIAIAAALRTRESLPEQYTVERVGIGLGKRDFGHANILRAMLISEKSDPDRIYVLESNIDDSNGEMLGLTMEKLMASGARDVHFIPCYMKKNRPAYLLRVIADAARVPELERMIFELTTTIGLRKFPVERACMTRESVELKLPFGVVQAKKCTWENVSRCYPEYESVKTLAENTGITFQTVFNAAKEMAEK